MKSKATGIRIPQEVKDAVESGMALIDKQRRSKKWVKKIDLKTLDQGVADKCLLSQLYGGYDEGLDKLFGDDRRNNCPQFKNGFSWGASVDWRNTMALVTLEW